ncbi:MAG: phosphoribosylglycinamide formyltransferase [Pseudomonadota bacterium]
MQAPLEAQKLRVGVLISGRGSNLKALIEAASADIYPAELVCVLSNRADAAGLDHAREANIPALAIPHKDFDDRAAFERALTRALTEHAVDLVCLAGFMRLLSGEFVRHWQGRLVNIHPSLLPAYKGLDVHRRMIEDAAKIAGCTVHYVTEDMDAGPIIDQRAVPILADDTPDSLAARILTEEHRLYPDCVRMIAEGKAPFVRGS